MNPTPFRLIVAIIALGSFAGTGRADRLEDGRAAYQQTCSRCHETGERGAPMVSNPEDWAGRSNLWSAVLTEHAVKGYFGMPAKGGSEDLDRYDMEVAAEYMLTLTYPDLPAD